jgi:hypothetical protein
MLLGAQAPKELWGEAILTALLLHNRLSVHEDGSTPVQRLTGQKLTTDAHYLHTWGCDAFVTVPEQLNTGKYEPTGVKKVFVGYEEEAPGGFRFLSMDGSPKITISRHAKFVDRSFSAMRAFRENREETDEGEVSEDWLDQAIWRNEQRLTEEESRKQYEREQQQRQQQQAAEPLVQPQPQQQHPINIVAPRPQRPAARNQVASPLSEPSSSPPSESSEWNPSDREPSSSPPLSDTSSRGRGRRRKPKESSAPTRFSSRSTRGIASHKWGMIDPRDLGVGSQLADADSDVSSYPASFLPADLSEQQVQQIEMMLEDEIFGGQAGIPRGSSPFQEQQRQEAIDAFENNQPFPLDRPRCNKAGEIVVPHRCVALKRNGEQCGARTRIGNRCWNHTQRDLNLRVKRSGILDGGKGLFAANKDYRNKMHVTDYTGDLSTDPDVDHGGSKYVVGISHDVTLDAARSDTALGRMINDPKGSGHPPNTRFAIDTRRRKVRIYATRPVLAGKEFFLPYGKSYWARVNEMAAEKAAKRKIKRRVKRVAKQRAREVIEVNAAEAQQLFVERDPLTHAQAMASPDAQQWREAERAEQKSLEDMKVYRFVTQVPAGAKLLDSKPVYKRKRDNNGKIVRHKNRLVARGFQQRDGIDYNATFAATVSYEAIRTILALATVHDKELKSMDVTTAFLHADLDIPQYMKIPSSFTNVPAGAVALVLDKSLYGLHQSGRRWQEVLARAISELKFTVGKHGDISTYWLKSRSGNSIVMGVFVDDILYSYNKIDEPEMEEIKSKLMSKFKIVDLGDATSILGMRIRRDRAARTLELDQEQYIKQCCLLLGLSKSKTMLTPENIAASHRRSTRSSSDNDAASSDSDSSDSESDSDEDIKTSLKLSKESYRSAVGMLGYAVHSTRPDVAHAYSMAARQQQDPKQEDLTALAHAFRYLLGSASLPLRYSSSSNKLEAFSDADWAGDATDARSTSGILLKLGGAAVSWSCQKQPNVALSSTEAEYIAASETAREVVWMRTLLAELGEAQAAPTPLLIDNESAIRMALEEGNQGRRKHINVKHHHIRELVTDGLVVLEWVPTSEQQADMLTKATSRKQFFAMRALAMGLTPAASHSASN